jgi:hypothetical protein
MAPPTDGPEAFQASTVKPDNIDDEVSKLSTRVKTMNTAPALEDDEAFQAKKAKLSNLNEQISRLDTELLRLTPWNFQRLAEELLADDRSKIDKEVALMLSVSHLDFNIQRCFPADFLPALRLFKRLRLLPSHSEHR